MAQVWINGKPNQFLNVADRSIAYGDGLFATMAVDKTGKIVFLNTHLAHLEQGAKRLGFNWLVSVNLRQHLTELAQTHPATCLKLLISRGAGGRGYAPPSSNEATEIVSINPLPLHYEQWRQTGIKLATSSLLLAKQPLLAGIKHLNRIEQVLIKSQSLNPSFKDWLVLDHDNNVIESSMANLFLLVNSENNKLVAYTASLAYSGVAGVMRERVIETLLTQGINVQVMPISHDMLTNATHLFICNSLLGIVDINQVDNIQFSRWQASAEFYKAVLRTQ